jgi:SNF2 family DNA or RNA helicase
VLPRYLASPLWWVTQLLARGSHSRADSDLYCLAICLQRKVANDPALVYDDCAKNVDTKASDSQYAGTDLGPHRDRRTAFAHLHLFGSGLLKAFPKDFQDKQALTSERSGKLAVLENLLAAIHREKGKVVVVSNFRETLNVIEEMCKIRQYK